MMSLMQGVGGRYRACHVINLRSDLIGMYAPGESKVWRC